MTPKSALVFGRNENRLGSALASMLDLSAIVVYAGSARSLFSVHEKLKRFGLPPSCQVVPSSSLPSTQTACQLSRTLRFKDVLHFVGVFATTIVPASVTNDHEANTRV